MPNGKIETRITFGLGMPVSSKNVSQACVRCLALLLSN
jgi:hypothetical protein